ncbi:MAG: HNH endonuclease [Bdellovibrionales bacterium]|nr:HNH endonuclease [Bdellovibrionales bacterium]
MKKLFRTMAPLICLRCGESAVAVPFLFVLTNRDTFSCRRCEAQHFLQVEADGVQLAIIYDRYTLRYPLEFYSDCELPAIAKLRSSDPYKEKDIIDESFSGPWITYPRKKSYSASEVQKIWLNSKGKCHLCNRKWAAGERSRSGWHIDHIVPHAGGGNTEIIVNLKVACAKCNLKKGRGYTDKKLMMSIRDFIETYQSWTSQMKVV